MRLYTFPAGLAPSVLLISTGILVAALPSTEYLGAAAAAIVGSALATFGVGYPIARKRKTDADIAAYQAREAAEKGTTLRALSDAEEQIRQLRDLNSELARLALEKDRQTQAILKAKDELIEMQMRELGDSRTEAERLRTVTIGNAMDILQRAGIIRKEGDPP